MRSATSGRFLGVWDFNPRFTVQSGCDGGAQFMWTLAEVAALQTRAATDGNPLGSYFWPVGPDFRGLGPTKVEVLNDTEPGDCYPGFKPGPEIVSVNCGSSAFLCAGVEQRKIGRAHV